MTTTPSTQPLPSTFTMEGVISITECPEICINSCYVLRPRDSILPLSFATTSQPSALYRLTSRHHATDMMTRSFLSNSRWLVSVGVKKEEGMKGGGESAVEMRPRKEDESFLCAWFSAVFCPLEGRGGRGGILLPPHLYKCGGTGGRNWTVKRLSR